MAGLLRTQWPLLIAVALTGYLVRAALPIPRIGSTVAGILFLTLAVAVAAAANHSRNRLQAFLKGAKGEEAVARALVLLPERFIVMHGLATHKRGILGQGGADLDHVVVGPAGIFVVETKNWNGAIAIENGVLICDGDLPSRPPLTQVKSAAAALRAQLLASTGLALEVLPILCFASNRLTPGQQGAAGVLVCNANQLTRVILAHDGEAIPEANRQAIVQRLRKDCDYA